MSDENLKCAKCNNPLYPDSHGLLDPCRKCLLEAREVAYDRGFDDGFDIARRKFN